MGFFLIHWQNNYRMRVSVLLGVKTFSDLGTWDISLPSLVSKVQTTFRICLNDNSGFKNEATAAARWK